MYLDLRLQAFAQSKTIKNIWNLSNSSFFIMRRRGYICRKAKLESNYINTPTEDWSAHLGECQQNPISSDTLPVIDYQCKTWWLIGIAVEWAGGRKLDFRQNQIRNMKVWGLTKNKQFVGQQAGWHPSLLIWNLEFCCFQRFFYMSLPWASHALFTLLWQSFSPDSAIFSNYKGGWIICQYLLSGTLLDNYSA